MTYIERNYKILEEKMISQMEMALKFGKKLIDTELDAGLFNVLIKPVVKTFYDYWSENNAKIGTVQQIKVTLDVGKKIVENGRENNFDELIENNFQEYLEGDQTYNYCKKDHKNFNRLKEITKECFISQVQETIKFLRTEKKVEDYDELTRETFKTKDDAYLALSKQLDLNDEGIKIVEKDPSILSVPTGKHIILKILRKGFEHTKKELLDRLDNIYN